MQARIQQIVGGGAIPDVAWTPAYMEGESATSSKPGCKEVRGVMGEGILRMIAEERSLENSRKQR